MNGREPHFQVLRPDDECIAYNYPFDHAAGVRVPRGPARRRTARTSSLFEVLSAVIEQRLTDENCVVEFSGGCDSSLVLAAAADACKRTGHELPIPLTYRFSAYPESDESAFQEEMVRYLGLKDWIIRDESMGFDLLGASAQTALRALGPVWPAQLMVRTESFRSIAPSLLLTGEGGDEVLGPKRLSALRAVKADLQRHRFSAAAGLARMTFAPVAYRARVIERNFEVSLPWLSGETAMRNLRLAAMELAREPLLARSWAPYYLDTPAVQVIRHNIEAFGSWCGIVAFSPLMDPEFVTAAAKKWPLRGWAERPAVLEAEFRDVLPDLVRRRRSKGVLDSVFFGSESRSFAQGWDASGLPNTIEADTLKEYWRVTPTNQVSAGTFLALHAAWAATSNRVQTNR